MRFSQSVPIQIPSLAHGAPTDRVDLVRRPSCGDGVPAAPLRRRELRRPRRRRRRPRLPLLRLRGPSDDVAGL